MKFKHLGAFAALILASASAFATNCGADTLHPGAGRPIWPDDCNTPTGGNPKGGTVTGTQQQAALGVAGAAAGAKSISGSKSVSQAAVDANQATTVKTGDVKADGGKSQSTSGVASTIKTGGTKVQTGDTSLQVNLNGLGASGAGGQGQLQGDVNSNNTTYRTTFIPPIVPPTAPSTVQTGNIVVERTICGPRQDVILRKVTAHDRFLWWTTEIPHGYTYDLAPAMNEEATALEPYKLVPFPDGSKKILGQQKLIFAGMEGVSASSNVAVGGGSGSGGWGQGGGGSSGAMTKIALNIQLVDCDLGTLVMVPIGRTEPPRIARPPYVKPPRQAGPPPMKCETELKLQPVKVCKPRK